MKFFPAFAPASHAHAPASGPPSFRAAALILLCAVPGLSAGAALAEPETATAPPALPRVLVIGDSISMNYHDAAKSALAGVADYHRNEGNAASSAHGVRNAELWLGDDREKGRQWDVIQFNHGLHDLKQAYDPQTGVFGAYTVSLDDYKKNLERIIAILQRTGAKLIWCSTTPVPNDNKGAYARRRGAARVFNDAAREVMRRHPDILVTDLFAVVESSPAFDEWRKGNDVHFYRDPERKLLGEAVAATVRTALNPRPGAPPAPAARPNILFLLTDDQQHDTIHALGNPAIRTPNLDRLAARGTAFRNAAIMGGTSPAVCSPSRASLLSGLTLWNLANQGEYGFEIPATYRTLPQVFRENGYVTFATGKNEPGRDGAFGRSFSTGDKILFRGMTGDPYRLPLCAFSPDGRYPRGSEVPHNGTHSTAVYADAAIRFLENQSAADQPFFAYVAFQAPHDPRQAPPEIRAMYPDGEMKLPAAFMPRHPFDNGMLKIRDENLAPIPRTPDTVRQHLADYYAMITHLDTHVGRILDALDRTGKAANTIVVFTSDNGLAVGRHGLMGKQNLYEHSVRIPLVMAGPGIPAGQVRGQLCYLSDLYPTLCERAGLATPDTVQFKSLNPAIADPAAPHRDHLYHAFMSWQRAVRDHQYKLIEYCVADARHTQLFDLAADPDELHNLAADPACADTLARLRQLLAQERVRLNDGNSPYPFTRKLGRDFWDAYENSSAAAR